MKMKDTKFICASPASTAVCMSIEQRSVVRPGSRALEQTQLLERQRSRVSEIHHARTDEFHYSRNGEQSSDGRYQRARRHSTHSLSATKNMSTVGKVEKNLSTPQNLSILSHHQENHPKASASTEVVVMRVSLHCKGCAGKLKKHISKMEGVTSFAIELEERKVTVVGNVSPMGVLESISKVKNAEFWPSLANL
ncbi:hypothetical protein SUGI_1061270 [Cryptomeria japonica]|uniref:protein SODIUM POTASSIUM ROOT DEFECTIVE 3 n=1 Tax=Cryptomeria japonica TaxID=3369 RepID=UPI0024148802|nr:protein SODIUM POTASSIUM ROOT DEFECTIVE 3 [Cryptomeria japonica]XP_057863840.1 protein SODIUM POTASSIUM ROOT DEFECTIVE 3 [Cryptomeria japonica]XP_057863841.1 protein SODIUM POTASSIUM ROOT DEFECTIVE 3 [Cryptomeria japonica]GLJ49917.1 hypothetical protein SUGI_1061270 [Cryptomeria japonica]